MFKFKKKTALNAPDISHSLTILSSITDGVVMIDETGKIQLFNPAAAKISGWTQEEAFGLDYRSVVVLTDQKGLAYSPMQDPLSRILNGEESVKDSEALLKTKSDSTVAVSVVASKLHSVDDILGGAVATIRDVTLERGEELKRAEFISTASHEMRTPVAAIEGYLALAMNDKVCSVDSRAKEYLDKAHSSTVHLGKLFQDLLTAAKSEDGRLSNHPCVTDMSEFIQTMAEDMRFSAEKKGLGIEFLIGAEGEAVDASGSTQKLIRPLYNAHVDPERMREVITNLFDNAVKYTESGKISLGITGEAKIVQIRISDTGPGIPPEDLPHLFQKFYRVDNSITRTIGGTGLGLFICRKIVELYNGHIWAESTLGKGSTFYINLPRLSNDRAESLRQAEQYAAKSILPQI